MVPLFAKASPDKEVNVIIQHLALVEMPVANIAYKERSNPGSSMKCIKSALTNEEHSFWSSGNIVFASNRHMNSFLDSETYLQ